MGDVEPHRLQVPEAHSHFRLAMGVLYHLPQRAFMRLDGGYMRKAGTEQVVETWVVCDVVCFVVFVSLFWRVVEVWGLTQFTHNSILE